MSEAEELENPFLKDYSGNILQGIVDMAKVSEEVTVFLSEKYGDEFHTANYILFLCVLTLGALDYTKCPVQAYIKMLRDLYELYQEVKKSSLLG